MTIIETLPQTDRRSADGQDPGLDRVRQEGGCHSPLWWHEKRQQRILCRKHGLYWCDWGHAHLQGGGICCMASVKEQAPGAVQLLTTMLKWPSPSFWRASNQSHFSDKTISSLLPSHSASWLLSTMIKTHEYLTLKKKKWPFALSDFRTSASHHEIQDHWGGYRES